MEPKTNESYKREILEQYRREKGGEMRGYLSSPTRKQIREACLWLLNKRKWKYDEQILNRFFQFDGEKSKTIQIQLFNPDRFVPIVKFLKGKTNDTSTENLELIAWLIDFKPRPLTEYLNSNGQAFGQEPAQIESGHEAPHEEFSQVSKSSSEPQPGHGVKKEKRRKLIVKISIVFGVVLIFATALMNWIYPPKKQILPSTKCMAWADSTYIEAPCSTQPYSQYGTKVEPFDSFKLENLKKIKVNMGTDFFAEDGKPMIWYYKNKDEEIEYFTAPGLHPVNGETLRKITPYIIETYVPLHSNKKSSFLKEN